MKICIVLILCILYYGVQTATLHRADGAKSYLEGIDPFGILHNQGVVEGGHYHIDVAEEPDSVVVRDATSEPTTTEGTTSTSPTTPTTPPSPSSTSPSSTSPSSTSPSSTRPSSTSPSSTSPSSTTKSSSTTSPSSTSIFIPDPPYPFLSRAPPFFNELFSVPFGPKDRFSLQFGTVTFHPFLTETVTVGAIAVGYGWSHPHYQSFDGRSFSFHGSCNYVLTETCGAINDELPTFRILGENHYTSEKLRQMKLSEVKNLQLEVYGHRLVLGPGGRVTSNGVHRNLPLYIGNETPSIEVQQDPPTTWVATDFGLLIEFTKLTGITIYLPPQYKGRMCGMLGDSNDDPSNDFKLPDGSMTTNVEEFGNAWKDDSLSNPSCDDGVAVSAGCTSAQMTAITATCSGLSDPNGPFKDCHSQLQPDMFVDICNFDLCVEFNNRNLLCDIYEDYAIHCELRKVTIDWRTPVFCPPMCGDNAHFELSATLCVNTCSQPDRVDFCKNETELTTSGCVCNDGYLLSGEECIKPEDCGCTVGGSYYKIGDMFYLNCSVVCTCKSLDNGICHVISSCPSDTICLQQNANISECTCPRDLNNPPECSKPCSVTINGTIHTPVVVGSKLPKHTKTIIAKTDSSDTDICKVKVVVRTNTQGGVDWAAVSTGLHPTKSDKYGRNFAFDLWQHEGAFMRGPKLDNLVPVVFPFGGWNDGFIYVTIQEITEGGWMLRATCGTGVASEPLLTFTYASGKAGTEYVQLIVDKPENWREFCYEI